MRAEQIAGLGGAPDRVEFGDATESGTELTGYKLIRADDPYLAGHFPDFTLYPGVFLIESVGQVVDEFARSRGLSLELAVIGSVRFTAPVVPGDRLTVRCRCVPGDDGTVAVRAECGTDAAPAVAALRLTYRIAGGAHV